MPIFVFHSVSVYSFIVPVCVCVCTCVFLNIKSTHQIEERGIKGMTLNKSSGMDKDGAGVGLPLSLCVCLCVRLCVCVCVKWECELKRNGLHKALKCLCSVESQ